MIVSRIGVSVLVGVTVWAVPVSAQSNLDAGKSAAQIFANTCNACHRSPREIKRTSAAFMREHYTTGMQEAAAMAAYLASVGSDPRAVEQRRKPAMGAGQAPVETAARPNGDAAKPSDAQALAAGPVLRTRRPAESTEAGKPLASAAGIVEQPTAVPALAVPAAAEFEE